MIKYSFGTKSGVRTYAFNIQELKDAKSSVFLGSSWYSADNIKITVTGEEYQEIVNIFQNIRKLSHVNQCTWFGEEAKFILWNLLELIDLGYFDGE